MKTITALCKGGPLHTLSNKAKTGTALYKGGPLHSGTFTFRDLYIPGPLHTVTDLDYFKYLDFLNINSNLFFRLLMELRHYKMSTLFYL